MNKSFSIATAAATQQAMKLVYRDPLYMLARHCPGLRSFDWINYLHCSQWRVEKVLDTIHCYYPTEVYARNPRVLDFGSWLGNFSLALAIAGRETISSEMWLRYSPALDIQKKALETAGVDCIDMNVITGRTPGPAYDVVLLMSVIEHLGDSPRRLLRILHESLKPSGLLILDTPNLAYIFNRRKFARGQSPFPPISDFFYSEAPFEGHVREYTLSELAWMLDVSGFEVLEHSYYDYSMYEEEFPYFSPPWGSVFWNRLESLIQPDKRELIFMVARKNKREF